MPLLRTVRFIIHHPLNRHRKLAAIAGYLRWQLGSRLVPGRVVIDWIGGAKLIVARSDVGSTGNLYCGLHEFQEMAFVLHAIRPDDLFVDVGANVGSYTILAAAVRGAFAASFEPVPTTYGRLCTNIQVNNLAERVDAYNIGLSDGDGVLCFSCDEDCMNHVIRDVPGASKNVVKVRVSTLDVTLRGRCPSVIKIDVEGFELPVLRGARAMLGCRSLHSVIVEMNGSGIKYGFNEVEIYDLMRGFEFIPCTYDPFARKVRELRSGERAGDNVLFVRELNAVADIVAHAPATTVHGRPL